MKMNFNTRLLGSVVLAVLMLVAATLSSWHVYMHLAYLFLGLALGMIMSKRLLAPRLTGMQLEIENCQLSKNGKNAGGICQVTVNREYCYIVNTPTPHRICFWVKETVDGRWSAEKGCCEVRVDGRTYCVRPARRLHLQLSK